LERMKPLPTLYLYAIILVLGVLSSGPSSSAAQPQRAGFAVAYQASVDGVAPASHCAHGGLMFCGRRFGTRSLNRRLCPAGDTVRRR
jgi:hypothetical protein